MEKKQKLLLIMVFILVGLGFSLIIQVQSLGKLRLIFCDVGQGDGMLIISPQGNEVIVDAGAGSKMADCLSQYLPLWDREIELIVPTHAHEEHMQGFIEVLARYKVNQILTTKVPNDGTQFYKEWEKAVNAEHANVFVPKIGDVVLLDPEQGTQSAKLEVLWPSRAQVESWIINKPADLNDSSIVMRLTFGDFCAYLTGDLPKELLGGLIDKKCQVLKVVHHGSRTGTSAQIIDSIKPQIAVIQLGKNNKFGHPHKEVLQILESKGVKILRNDIDGTVEVDTDGKSFSVNSEK